MCEIAAETFLVPMDNKIRNEIVSREIKEVWNKCERDNKNPLSTKLTNLVVDNAFSLTVGLRDDITNRRNEEGI
ncbi:MAG TPA: hypothetical protein VKA87_04670 [Nitrososphaeraceae archaeon]|nr:hypothetical protein [Nitrososphaeraceae archaeon]